MQTGPQAPGARVAREARDDELGALAACLARAFQDDPVTTYLFPDPGVRRRRLPRFYALVASEMRRSGRVETLPGVLGAALWRAPAAPGPHGLDALRLAVGMVGLLRARTRRARDFFERVESVHLREPHWYLGVLGTDPTSQGRGVGSRLLATGLARCDAAGMRAYLESSKRENIPFYERYGFEVTCELTTPEGPTVWPMVRPPRSAGK